MTRYRKEFRKIARRLTLTDIQSGVSENHLTLDSLFDDGRVKPSSNFLLGVFSQQGIMKVLEVFGFLRLLKTLGLTKVSIDIDTGDPHTHRIYAYNGPHKPENKICELVLKKGSISIQTNILPNFPSKNLNLLQVEWLLLQNPNLEFSEKRPQLPGQSHPGLGVGDRLMELLIIMTKRLRLEGIINNPNYFHTAFMFTKEFVFVNPTNEAILHAMSRDLLTKFSFHTVAWAAHLNCVVNTISKSIFSWKPEYLILPLSKDLIRYFRSREYQKEVQRLTKKYRFDLDKNRLVNEMNKHNLEIHEDLY